MNEAERYILGILLADEDFRLRSASSVAFTDNADFNAILTLLQQPIFTFSNLYQLAGQRLTLMAMEVSNQHWQQKFRKKASRKV